MTTGCLLNKDDTGFSQSRITCSHPFCQKEFVGSKDNLKEEMEDTFIGSSWSPPQPRRLWGTSRRSLEGKYTLNSQDHPPQSPMSGRKTPELATFVSNLDAKPLNETPRPIGSGSRNSPSPENLMRSPKMYTYVIMGISSELQPIMLHRLEWSELATFIGVRLDWVSQSELGTRPVWKLILRIPGLNGGVATVVNQLLSSMNFGVISVLATCSDGWIVIQSQWKPKEVLLPYELHNSGLLATLIHENGIRT